MPSHTHEQLVRRLARLAFDPGEAVEFDRGIPASLATYKAQRAGQKYARPDALGFIDGELAVVEVDQVAPGVFREQVIELNTHAALVDRIRAVRGGTNGPSNSSSVGAAVVGAMAGAIVNEAVGRKVHPLVAGGIGAWVFLALRE